MLFDGSEGIERPAFAISDPLPSVRSITCSASHILDDDVFSRFRSESAVISSAVKRGDEIRDILDSGARGSVSVWGMARVARAACKWDGKIRPRFSARRRMPRAALALKKNLCGTRVSKISDNEHSSASLGHSEISAVKHAPRNPIPAFDHENAEDFRKVSSSV